MIISCNADYLSAFTPIKQRQLTKCGCLEVEEKEDMNNDWRKIKTPGEHKVTRIGIGNKDPGWQQTEQQIQGEGNTQFAGQVSFTQIINKHPEPALKMIVHKDIANNGKSQLIQENSYPHRKMLEYV